MPLPNMPMQGLPTLPQGMPMMPPQSPSGPIMGPVPQSPTGAIQPAAGPVGMPIGQHVPLYPGHPPPDAVPTNPSLQAAIGHIAGHPDAENILSKGAMSGINDAVTPGNDESLKAALQHVATHPMAADTLSKTTMTGVQNALNKINKQSTRTPGPATAPSLDQNTLAALQRMFAGARQG